MQENMSSFFLKIWFKLSDDSSLTQLKKKIYTLEAFLCSSWGTFAQIKIISFCFKSPRQWEKSPCCLNTEGTAQTQSSRPDV